MVHIATIDCEAFQLNQALFDLPALLSTMSKIQEIFSIRRRMEVILALTVFLLNLITSDTAPVPRLFGSGKKLHVFQCLLCLYRKQLILMLQHPHRATHILLTNLHRHPPFCKFPLLRLTRSHNITCCGV